MLTWLRLVVTVEELCEHRFELGAYDSGMKATLSIEIVRRFVGPVHPLLRHM